MKKINIDNVVFKIKDYESDVKLKKGYAYIKGDYVYPYRGKKNNHKKVKMGIYKDGEENIFINAMFREEKKKYKVKNIEEIDDMEFVSSIIKKNGVKEIDDVIINSDVGEYFIPPIMDGDIPAQKMIKMALANKKINLKNYASRFRSATDVNNHRRALSESTSISFDKLDKWCSVCDLDFELIIKDKEKSFKPMNKILHYTTDTDEINVIDIGDQDDEQYSDNELLDDVEFDNSTE